MKAKKVGVVSERVIELLELDICAGTPIYLGESNIIHMKTSHLNDYIKYGDYISLIINNADYVGINSSDNSIEYVKEFVGIKYCLINLIVLSPNIFSGDITFLYVIG